MVLEARGGLYDALVVGRGAHGETLRAWSLGQMG